MDGRKLPGPCFIPGSQAHRRAHGISVGLRAHPGLAPLQTPRSPALWVGTFASQLCILSGAAAAQGLGRAFPGPLCVQEIHPKWFWKLGPPVIFGSGE